MLPYLAVSVLCRVVAESMSAKLKQRKCKASGCQNTFMPFNSLEQWCSPACGFALAQDKLAAAKRKEALKTKRKRNAAKKAFREKDIKHVRKGAVAYLHKWIRWRDRDLPCIACNKSMAGKAIHASHYRPSGQNSAVRFHEDNIHAGCAQCNTHKSGNLTEYRSNLLTRIGHERVEWLESQTHVKRWTIDELKAIRQEYADRLRALDIKLPTITH